jgi:hypothetical protein
VRNHQHAVAGGLDDAPVVLSDLSGRGARGAPLRGYRRIQVMLDMVGHVPHQQSPPTRSWSCCRLGVDLRRSGAGSGWARARSRISVCMHDRRALRLGHHPAAGPGRRPAGLTAGGDHESRSISRPAKRPPSLRRFHRRAVAGPIAAQRPAQERSDQSLSVTSIPDKTGSGLGQLCINQSTRKAIRQVEYVASPPAVMQLLISNRRRRAQTSTPTRPAYLRHSRPWPARSR